MTTIERDIASDAAPDAADAQVLGRLIELPRAWRTLPAEHAAASAYVVVGPAGVFLVCPVHYPQSRICVRGDVFTADGIARTHVGQLRAGVRRLAATLTSAAGVTVPVHGVLVVVGAQGGFAVKEQPHDGVVKVVTCKTLTLYLHSLATTLDAAARAHICDAATPLSV